MFITALFLFYLNILQSINIMGHCYWNGEFLGQNWGKRETILLGEAAFIRPLQRRVFWPCLCKFVTILMQRAINFIKKEDIPISSSIKVGKFVCQWDFNQTNNSTILAFFWTHICSLYLLFVWHIIVETKVWL